MTISPPHLNQTTIDGECTLSDNVMNDKIYLFLWFWFVFLFIVGIGQIFFQLAIFAMPMFRQKFIELFYSSDKKGKIPIVIQYYILSF